MSNHNEEKEAIEAALERAANYRGVPLCTTSITRVDDWVTHDDGTITGPHYAVVCAPSSRVKSLIDASLDADETPIDPPVDETPIDPPAGPAKITGMTLTAESASGDLVFNIGETIRLTAFFTLSDGTTKPASYKMSSHGGFVTFPNMWQPVGEALKAGVATINCDNSGFTGSLRITIRNADGSMPPETPVTPVTPPKDTTPNNPSNPTTNPSLPPIPPSNGAASHTVIAIVVDGGGIEWKAEGTVGNDATVAGQLANLKNADGVDHGGLQAMFYADCCHVSIQRCDYPYSEAGCTLSVTYDGQPASVPPSSYPDGTVTFWRGSWMPAIRYGAQVPFDAAKIDWSVLPNYANEKQSHIDINRFDWTFNGLGGTRTPAMGTTGERDEIGYMQVSYMAFITDPCQETWDLVRKTEDWSGNWRMCHVADPVTGKILKTSDYPNITLLSAAQGIWKDNPIVRFKGVKRGDAITPSTSSWTTSDSPYVTDVAHLTSYGMLASMITGATHDKDLCSFWGNYPMMATNPSYYRDFGFIGKSQREAAWSMRSIFVAAFHSSDNEYFADEIKRNVPLANNFIRNDFGIMETAFAYTGEGAATGYKGVALWMQSYLAMVTGAVGQKFPEMIPFAQFLGKLEVLWFSKPYALQRTIYAFMCIGPDGKMLGSLDEMVRISMLSEGYTEAEAAATIAATTVQDAFEINQSYYARRGKTWGGKCVDGISDFRSGQTLASSYPAGAIASVYSAANVGTPGIEQAVQYVDNLPTKINYTNNQKYHIVEKD